MTRTNIINNIITSISIILFGFCVFKTYSYYKLNKEYTQYKLYIENTTDSLLHVNNNLEDKLDSIYVSCEYMKNQIDSLEDVKQKIIIKKESYKINDNILMGVKMLKQNLLCVDLH